jgi:demethylmenaquinone methyltransferase/2-methoxy-6-polyprenyl-1,4-benzoquinol methylase
VSQPHDHIVPFADSGKSKKKQVEEMFDGIAGKYDLLNRTLSARTDLHWRRKAIRKLRSYGPGLVLDVATGTADMAIMACRSIEGLKVIGIDISEGMLEMGRKKIDKEGLQGRIELQRGDSEAINYRENTFDAVMVAFGVRNFENLEKGLQEMRRVLKPGGRLIVLEFSRPKRKLVKGIYRLYMRIIAPGIARWFRQNKQAYQYLNDSADAFPDREQFTSILDRIGYKDTGYKPLSLGICCIYSGKKS